MQKIRKRVWIVAGLLLAGLLCWWAGRRPVSRTGAVTAGAQQQDARRASAEVPANSKATQTNQILRLRREQVLASVNNQMIRLEDLFPLGTNDTRREFELQDGNFQYLLKRAIDRELVFQLAEKQGLHLNDSQTQQISAYTAERHEPEPGGIARLNNSETGIQFELRDARAFMLQTALMASIGDSPNVTETQVSDYFQQHRSDFPESADNSQPDQPEWRQIQAQIRLLLAPVVRATYNQELTDFMSRAEANAHIVMFSGSDMTGAN